MIWLVLLLLAGGIFLSAFFSGSETGFYRVTRVRLLLDGLGGDLVSRMLLRLTNHPALFVATTLIGNNVANYLTSLAIVLAVHLLFTHSQVAETVAPLVLSPAVFVYCELLPKQLFFRSPNRLLRRSGPLLLFFAVLFAPVAAILWILGWLLQHVVGQTPLRVRLTLARKELQQLLQEGQEVGILHTVQRDLAQKLFAHASNPVLRFTTPVSRIASVPLGATKQAALQVARRQQSPILLIRQAQGKELVGYTHVIDLELDDAPTILQARPLPRFARHESHLKALVQMQEQKADVAIVEDRHGNTVGLLYASQLTEPLFQDV